MKTKFTTIIAAVALLVSTTFTIAKAENGAVELNSIGTISKIEANGNVDVYLVNGDYDGVKVYNDYYSENAVVSNTDGVLHITSYADERLVVMVTVSDLQSVAANDNASVRSYGDALSAKAIDITVNDKAIVQFKIDAIAANVTVKDGARAELAGNIENYELSRAATATINSNDLKTFSSREYTIEQPQYKHKPAIRFALHASL